MDENAKGYAIFMLNAEGRVVTWNRGAERILGYREQDILGESATVLLAPEDRQQGVLERVLSEAVAAGETVQDERWHVRKDGSRFWGRGAVTPLYRDSGTLRGFLKVMQDETERKQAEEALAWEKERLLVTLESLTEGVITTDAAGGVVLMNRAAELMTGWPLEEARGKTVSTVFEILEESGEPRADPVREMLEAGSPVDVVAPVVLHAHDGARRVINYTCAPVGPKGRDALAAVLVFRDVSQQKRWQDNLLKAQKLEALGLLAGGIAHDFNNILTAIFGNIALAKMYAAPGDKIYEALTDAEGAFTRARDLTHKFLTFSRGGAPIRRTASLAQLVRDVAPLAISGAHNIRIEFSLPPDLWPVRLDPDQMSQAITNILINCVQAMPAGGVVRIEGRNLALEDQQIEGLHRGNYVALRISDTGPGIPPAALPKIFDPYFTTKQPGSGLGLATAHSIVKRHGGHIEAESVPGHGATIIIILPAEAAAQREPQPREDQGRVLLMDDDPMVRNAVGQLLRRLGYEVGYASEGGEAVRRYAEALKAGRPYDAVILDLVVTEGMGGQECMRALLAMHAEAKVIASSGYVDDPVMAAPTQFGFRAAVPKPYELPELERVLRELIGDSKGVVQT